jgi:hypothetical protein
MLLQFLKYTLDKLGIVFLEHIPVGVVVLETIALVAKMKILLPMNPML